MIEVDFTVWETREYRGRAVLDLPDDADDLDIKDALDDLISSEDLYDITSRDEQEEVALRSWWRTDE